MKIIGIGDNVMDAYLFQQKLYPGGNSVNVPVLARRFGAEKAGYIGILGDDAPGKHFYQVLEREGLDVSRVRVAHGETGRNYISLDEQGDRHFVGNNGIHVVESLLSLSLNFDDCHVIESYDVAHTSVHSFLDDELSKISRYASLSMDFSDGYNYVNIRKLAPLLRFAFFSGGKKSMDEVRQLAHYAMDCGARTVVVTMGMRGSYLVQGEDEHFQGVTPAKVVDALGAGDAYIAAFLTAYTDGASLSQAAQRAADFAAKCCEHYGAFGNACELPEDHAFQQRRAVYQND